MSGGPERRAEGTLRSPFPRLRPGASTYSPVGPWIQMASWVADSTALPACHTPKSSRKHPRQATQAASDRDGQESMGQQSPLPCWVAAATDTCPGLRTPPSRTQAPRSDPVRTAHGPHLLRAEGLTTGTLRAPPSRSSFSARRKPWGSLLPWQPRSSFIPIAARHEILSPFFLSL